MLALRPYTPLRMVLTVCGHCFSEDPDREIDYETDILQGNLVAMDGARLPAPDLPARPRRGDEPVRGGPRASGSTSSSGGRRPARSSPTPPATPGRSRWATSTGSATSRPSTRACSCSTSPRTATSSARPASPRRRRGSGGSPGCRTSLRSLDAAIEREGGRVDVLMLSGGEPTVHPEVLEIIEAATERDVTRVILNTNGIRIARDDRFLARARPAPRPGRGLPPVRRLRARRRTSTTAARTCATMKAEALRRLAAERVFTTLAVAVAEGVNDHEVGAIAEYALATDFIAGVAFQPMFGSGRANPIDPMRRATTTGTLLRLGAQTADRVGPDDFIALPCSHPDCSSITYFIRGDGGEWRSVPRMLGDGPAEGVPRPGLEPDRARRRDVDGARRDDVGDDARVAARAHRPRPPDLRGLRPRRDRVRQEPGPVAVRSRARPSRSSRCGSSGSRSRRSWTPGR